MSSFLTVYDVLIQEWAAEYWFSKGAPKHKLIIGIATYGRSFMLSNSIDTRIGARTSNPGNPGAQTGESGFLAYYEVRTYQEFVFL